MKTYTLILLLTLLDQTLNSQRLYLAISGSTFFAISEMLLYKYKEGYYFTTWQQFGLNMIFVPFMIQDYYYYIEDWLLRYLLFPFNVWLFEIIMANILYILIQENPCWYYKTKYSYFNGTIALDLYPRWLLFGIVIDNIYPYFK